MYVIFDNHQFLEIFIALINRVGPRPLRFFPVIPFKVCTLFYPSTPKEVNSFPLQIASGPSLLPKIWSVSTSNHYFFKWLLHTPYLCECFRPLVCSCKLHFCPLLISDERYAERRKDSYMTLTWICNSSQTKKSRLRLTNITVGYFI